MNGGHDLGGMHGLGPVDPVSEPEETPFHDDWERRVFGLTLAAGLLGRWNIDAARHARERQHPADYLSNIYYRNWMVGLEKLLVESGVLTVEELAGGVARSRPGGAVSAEGAAGALERGGPADMPLPAPPCFAVGDRVRVRNDHPAGHTRAPRYVRGRTGRVVLVHGGYVFPDENAAGRRVAAALYNVRFEAAELWGRAADRRSAVHVDLFQPYLEPAA